MARHIQHHAAVGEPGLVLDCHRLENNVFCACQNRLAQRLYPIKNSGFTCARYSYAVFTDCYFIGFFIWILEADAQNDSVLVRCC